MYDCEIWSKRITGLSAMKKAKASWCIYNGWCGDRGEGGLGCHSFGWNSDRCVAHSVKKPHSYLHKVFENCCGTIPVNCHFCRNFYLLILVYDNLCIGDPCSLWVLKLIAMEINSLDEQGLSFFRRGNKHI